MKRLILFVFLSLVCGVSIAAPVPDTANKVNDSSSFTGTGTSTSVTVGASDNLLLVFTENKYNTGPAVAPNGFTYNGVALTKIADNSNWGGGTICDICGITMWALVSPATGTHTLVGTWTTNTSGGQCDVFAIPVSGAATSSTFGTAATNQSGSTRNPAVTATGGSSGTLYFGANYNFSGTTTGSSSGIVDLGGRQSIGGGANESWTVSTMPGTSGAFTWTGSANLEANQWGALGVNVNGAGSTCTHSFWRVDGNFAIPNGTTGSYWNAGTGAFSTPDCSTGVYTLSNGGKGAS